MGVVVVVVMVVVPWLSVRGLHLAGPPGPARGRVRRGAVGLSAPGGARVFAAGLVCLVCVAEALRRVLVAHDWSVIRVRERLSEHVPPPPPSSRERRSGSCLKEPADRDTMASVTPHATCGV